MEDSARIIIRIGLVSLKAALQVAVWNTYPGGGAMSPYAHTYAGTYP